MTYSFNLVDQKWIPCVRFDGHVDEFSLRETLASAHKLRGIQGESPLETAALFRLLLAVLHSALRGPRKKSEWVELWECGKGNWDKPWLHRYLDAWKQHFDIFDPKKPFYQFKDERMAQKPSVQLAHGMGTANELFDHMMVTENLEMTCSQAARTLLVGQSFGLGGLGHPQLKIYLTNANLTRGIIFLVEGDNLFQTLILNLVGYVDDEPLPILGEDKPCWEMENPFLPIRQQPRGYLDYLTWQNRKLLLNPELDQNGKVVIRNFYIARGLDLGEVRDPFKQYTKTEKGRRQQVFTENRNLWRDSDALFRLKTPDTDQPPKTFKWLSDIILEEEVNGLDNQQRYRYMALGIGMHYKDAKIYFYRQEHMPLPLSYLANNDLVEQLTDALTRAEYVRSSLWIATNTLAKIILSPMSEEKNGRQPDPGDVEKLMNYWNTERFYWQQLEIPFLHFLEYLPDHPESLDLWRETIRQAAWDALEHTANAVGFSALALKAAERARGRLGYSLKKLFVEPEKEAIT